MEICNKIFCIGCSLCVNICPKQCVRMELDSLGFLYPIVDDDKCIRCNLCKKKCPVNE